MEDLVDDGADGDDARTHELIVDAAQAGGRLDAVIAAAIPELSRAQAQRLIEEGRVTVDGEVAGKSLRLKVGHAIEVVVPPPEPLEAQPEPIPLDVMFEDTDLIVIDKPAGLVVHPAVGHATGTLVNALLHHCKDLSGIGGVLRPGIVHRLDKDTSGVMVAAKSDRAHTALVAQFAAKSRGEALGPGGIERTYLAITSPAPPTVSGTLRTTYGRHATNRKRFSSKVAGKSAVTHWMIERALHESALVRFRLETGRTHQIRVHASDHGWALVGDPIYGHKPRDERIAEVAKSLARQALHASTLAFAHPVTGAALSFESLLPDDLQKAIAALSVRDSVG